MRNITHNHEIDGLKEKVLHEAKHIVSDNLETVLTVSESNDLINGVTVIYNTSCRLLRLSGL